MSDTSPSVSGLPRPDAGTVKLEEQRLQQFIAHHLAKRASKTTQLEQEDKQRLPFGTSMPYGLDAETSARFIPLPAKGQTTVHHWLIEIAGFAGRPAPIGIKVVGDVVLGVAREGFEAPDLDLSMYQGDEKGVSRRHAVIRPSRNRLYLIDLQSTNGTRVNAVPVGSGVAMELRHQDTVALGALTFTVRVLASPADFEKAQATQALQGAPIQIKQ